MKYFNYTKVGAVENGKKPFTTHLVWEHSTYGLYFVDSADQTVLLKTTDKGVTVTTVDISDNANSYKIQAGWLDGVDLWLVMCDNDGTADDFEVCYIEMDDSDDCNPITVSAGADINTVYAFDIFKIGTDHFVINYEERAGSRRIVIWDVDANPFVEKDNEAIPGRTYEAHGVGVVNGPNYYSVVTIDNAGTKQAQFLYYNNGIPALNQGATNDGYSLASEDNKKGMAYDNINFIYMVVTKIADGLDYLVRMNVVAI